jgi:hypothetical protein
LVFTSAGDFEFNGSSWIDVGKVGGVPILLPTGQVFLMQNSTAVLFTPKGTARPSWAPKIESAPRSLRRGHTYKVSGTQFNGLSQAMAYGDECQNATNYPLVRITLKSSGLVYYARTHDHSSMGVATGSLLVWTYFDVPKRMTPGPGTLEVIANGIASKPVSVTVQ